MSTRSYIGIHDPDQPGQVRLRYVHSDGAPGAMTPTLRKIWAGAAAGDTHRLAALLLEHDWDYLDPDTTDDGNPPFAGARLIPGVGVALAAAPANGPVTPPEPVTVVAFAAVGDLDAQWIYLLDPDTGAVTVHTSDGHRVGAEPLAS